MFFLIINILELTKSSFFKYYKVCPIYFLSHFLQDTNAKNNLRSRYKTKPCKNKRVSEITIIKVLIRIVKKTRRNRIRSENIRQTFHII